MPLLALVLAALLTTAASAEERPTMRQLAASPTLAAPPSKRELVDARAALNARFKGPLSHTETAAGARTAATMLLDAAHDETEPALKWLLLDEARRLGAAAGSAEIVSRAITLTSAVFDVDELAAELESLGEIPLRALDPGRAGRLAEAAERIAARADTDGRPDLATDARLLAYKAWQRAGNPAAARR
ncbi:MAG: hypothetical protein ACKOB1_10485, partial [Planctomycetia bacterium]